jgi:cytochrome c biogenesis protein CcmG/thiol:disulfide interchange protein DsbE
MAQSAIPPSPHGQSLLAVWSRRVPAILLLGFLSFLYLKRQLIKMPARVEVMTLGLVDVDGRPLPDSLVRGKAVVLNYWAPWCPPCRVEIPWLQQLQAAHPHNLLIVGVVADDSQYRQAKEFMRQQGVSYPIVRESASMDSVFGHVAGLPTTFYISSSGKVLHAASGLIPESLMQHYVNDTIAN